MNTAKCPLTSHFFSFMCGMLQMWEGWGPHATLFSSNPICPVGCKSRRPLLPWPKELMEFSFSIGQNRWLLLQRAGPPSLHPHYHHFYWRQRCSAIKIVHGQNSTITTNDSFVGSVQIFKIADEQEHRLTNRRAQFLFFPCKFRWK